MRAGLLGNVVMSAGVAAAVAFLLVYGVGCAMVPPDFYLKGGERHHVSREDVVKPVEPEFSRVDVSIIEGKPVTSEALVGRWLHTFYETRQLANCSTLIVERKTRTVQAVLEFRSDGSFWVEGEKLGCWAMDAKSNLSFSGDVAYAGQKWKLGACEDGTLIRYPSEEDNELYRRKLMSSEWARPPYSTTASVKLDHHLQQHVCVRHEYEKHVWINSWVLSPGKLVRLGVSEGLKPAPAAARSVQAPLNVNRVNVLQQLRDAGVITEEEYKKELGKGQYKKEMEKETK